MKNYLDRITMGYVSAFSKFNELDTAVRSMFAHNHLSGGEMDRNYLQVMMAKNKARVMVDRWFRVFNSATKRFAK